MLWHRLLRALGFPRLGGHIEKSYLSSPPKHLDSMKKPKVYTKEFKVEAVLLAQKEGFTQTGRNLGVNANLLHKWKNQMEAAEENAQQAFPGKGHPQDEELARLRRELRQAQEDNEILKKAVGIFSIRPR